VWDYIRERGGGGSLRKGEGRRTTRGGSRRLKKNG